MICIKWFLLSKVRPHASKSLQTQSVFTLLISDMPSCSVASTSSEDKTGQQLGANVFSLGHNKGIMVSAVCLSHFTIFSFKIGPIF